MSRPRSCLLLRTPCRLIVAMVLFLGVAAVADSTVVFNEIQYHPAAAEPDLEWIELHNQMAVNMDLSRWQVAGGIQFRFPESTVVPGRGYLVVASNPTALIAATGATNVVGPFTGRLSNAGETLELRNNNQRLMDSVKYGTDGAWPVGPDGTGVSLAKRTPNLASGPAENWMMSAQIGGTPGSANFPSTAARPVIELVGAGQGWRIEGSGTDLGTAWREAGFDDAKWISAAAPIYGGDAPAPGGEVKAIPTLFNTGVGADGRTLPPGTTDPHYVMTASAEPISPSPPAPALVITGHPAWLANDETSSWLGPVEPGTVNVAAGSYRLRTTFDLAGFDATTAALTLTVAADNRLNNVLLNGQSRNLAFVGFESFSPEFRITGGLTAGVNALEFLWANDSSSPNPAGFRAKLSGTARTVSPPESRLPRVESVTYFRTAFLFSGNPAGIGLGLQAFVDDGAVFYLNGVEILRLNLPDGPVTWDTRALTDVASPPVPVSRDLAPGLLRSGTNVLAVELHQAVAGSNDAWFDLRLATRSAAASEAASVVLNEVAPAAAGFFVELANRSAGVASLGGYQLLRSGAEDAQYLFPEGTTIPAGGFLALTEDTLGFRPGDGDQLALVNPGRAAVADAVVVKGKLRGRFPDVTGRWLFPTFATPGTTNAFALRSEIVLYEIFYHPHSAAPSGTWIELFNRGSQTVDLTGWRLGGGIDFRFAAGTSLAAGAYLVVAQDPAALQIQHPGIAIVGPFDNSLSRQGERILLEDAFGNPADEVRYFDGGRWPELADGGGSSLELREPRADNAVPESWAPSRESPTAGWAQYSYTATAVSSPGPTQWHELVVGLLDAGECLLDDFKVIESPAATPVSLLQNGDFERGATSWRVLGTHRLSRVIVDPDNPGNHVLHLVATGPTEHMHNHVETTFVNNRAIVNGRTYEVSFRAKWLGGDPQLNTRLYFNRVARTTTLAVPVANGTPGARNSTYEPNTGPTFTNLRQAPVVPEAGQPVAVTVEAADPDGVASARVFWSANGGAWQNQELASGPSGRFAGTLPGATAGTVVQFYVQATDGTGAVASSPAGGPNSRALYIVNDRQASLAKLHNLRILMTPQDRGLLLAATNVMSNEFLGATVVSDEEEVFYDAGVHLQGSQRGRLDSSRVGFTLHFPPDHLFRGVHDALSIDRSGGYTGVGADQDEIVLKHVIQHAGGLPGMYDDLVRVIAPRADLTGSGLLILAKYGDGFLDSQFANGSDGNLFKLELVYAPTSTLDGTPQSPKLPQPDDVLGVDITDLGNDPEVYRWFFLQENNRRPSDYRQIIALAKAMRTTGTTLDVESRRLMDVDLWMRAVAFLTLFGMVDTYPFDNPHNFMIYFRPEDGRALPFLWDLDFNFGAAPTAPLNRATGNLARLMALPGNQRRFLGHLLDIITTTYNPTYLAPWLTHYGGLVGQNFSGIRSYVSQRVASVRSQLPATVPFSVTSGGNPDVLVDAAQIDLSGRAWIDVDEIRFRDRPETLAWRWSNTTTWQTTVPLMLGSNRIELQAYDFQGNLLASNVVTVTSTSTRGAPDADGDGMPDTWEGANGLEAGLADGEFDADRDGLTNLQEYLAGTDPRDSASRLQLDAARRPDHAAPVHLSFLARAGRSYSVLVQDAVAGGASGWQRLSDTAPAATDRTAALDVAVSPASPSRFYRLVTPQMP